MANIQRGQVELKAGDKTYTLQFTVNAICELEARLGLGIAKIAKTMSEPAEVSLTFARALAWAALRSHHPNLTLDQAGDIVQEVGMTETIDQVGLAFMAAFPPPKEVEGTGGPLVPNATAA